MLDLNKVSLESMMELSKKKTHRLLLLCIFIAQKLLERIAMRFTIISIGCCVMLFSVTLHAVLPYT